MKSGLPWNLRGVDEETRAAVIEAARLSGLSVSDWLNQVLGDHVPESEAAPETPSPRASDDSEAGALARSIEKLTQRLGAMDDTSRAAISGLADRLDEIERHISRVSDAGQPGGDRARSLKGVSAMVKDLAREIDNADERARSMVEGLRARAVQPAPAHRRSPRSHEAISELDQRIAALRERLAAPAPVESRPLKLDEIRARLNTLLAQSAARSLRPRPSRRNRCGTEGARRTHRRCESAHHDAPTICQPSLWRRRRHTADGDGRTDRPRRGAPRRDRRAHGRERGRTQASRKKDAELAAGDPRNFRASAHHRRPRRDPRHAPRPEGACPPPWRRSAPIIGALTEQVTADQPRRRRGTRRFLRTRAADRRDGRPNGPLDRSHARRHPQRPRHHARHGRRRRAQATLGAIEAAPRAIAAQLSHLLRIAPDRARLDELGEEVSALRRCARSGRQPARYPAPGNARIGTRPRARIDARQQPARDRTPPSSGSKSGCRTSPRGSTGFATPGAQTAAIHTVEQRLDGRLNEIADRLGGMMSIVPQSHRRADCAQPPRRAAGRSREPPRRHVRQRHPAADGRHRSGAAPARRAARRNRHPPRRHVR